MFKNTDLKLWQALITLTPKPGQPYNPPSILDQAILFGAKVITIADTDPIDLWDIVVSKERLHELYRLMETHEYNFSQH